MVTSNVNHEHVTAVGASLLCKQQYHMLNAAHPAAIVWNRPWWFLLSGTTCIIFFSFPRILFILYCLLELFFVHKYFDHLFCLQYFPSGKISRYDVAKFYFMWRRFAGVFYFLNTAKHFGFVSKYFDFTMAKRNATYFAFRLYFEMRLWSNVKSFS